MGSTSSSRVYGQLQNLHECVAEHCNILGRATMAGSPLRRLANLEIVESAEHLGGGLVNTIEVEAVIQI